MPTNLVEPPVISFELPNIKIIKEKEAQAFMIQVTTKVLDLDMMNFYIMQMI